MYVIELRMAWTKNPKEAFKNIVEMNQKALSIDDKTAEAYIALGSAYLTMRQHEKAIEHGQKAIEVGPNSALSHILFAQIMYYSGNIDKAIALAEQGVRLCPGGPEYYRINLARAYMLAGRYQEALVILKKLLEQAQGREFELWRVNHYLALTYSLMGETEKAQIHLAEAKKFNPKLSLEYVRKTSYFKDPKQLEVVLDALRKAGLSETPPLPVPENPSIAILAFTNMSGDPKQELFSDGLAENIITQLTKIPEMVVIARTSSFRYKGKSVTVQQVGQELGVRYVLEGSVLQVGNQLRITAQLVDAKTGAHLWAQAYDRQLEDFFQVQDEITLKVVNALQVKLTEGTKDHLFKARTNNLKAYAAFIECYKLWEKFNKEDNERAKEVVKKAIALDPDSPLGYSAMAWIHISEYLYGWSKDPKRSLQVAEEYSKKAIATDETEPTAHAALSQFYSQKGQFDLAIKEMERALELAPSDAGMVSQYGLTRYWVGEYEEGLKMMKKAMVLRPFPPPHYLARLGMGYYLTEQYEEAATVLTSSSKKFPRFPRIRLWLIPTLVALGREKEARDAAEKLLEIDPKFSAKTWANRYFAPYKDPKVKVRILEQYAKAGLS
jgi:adenylate cyclase